MVNRILEEKIMQIKLNIDSLKNQNNDDSKDKKILLNEINQIILNIKEEKNYLEKVYILK